MNLITFDEQQLTTSLITALEVVIDALLEDDFIKKEDSEFVLRNYALILQKKGFFSKLFDSYISDDDTTHKIIMIKKVHTT